MNKAEFPDDSDTSDEDYNPVNSQREVVSEVESDGDPEDPLSDDDIISNSKRKKRHGKLRKTRKKIKNGIDGETDENETSPRKNELTEDEKKKHADDLWASFKKDTGFKAKTMNGDKAGKRETKENTVKTTAPVKPPSYVQEKVKVTQIFEFAGEEVKVEKEVPIDSAEARVLTKPCSSDQPQTGRAGVGGISTILSQLGKKQKISTLEKSKLDWDTFKREENIEEELKNFNKGKDGYLERQDFLQRADLRRFEIEKEIRTIERNKRMNNL